MRMRASSVTDFGSGVPSKPTSSTSTPWAAERTRVIQHAGAASEVSERDDDGSHVGNRVERAPIVGARLHALVVSCRTTSGSSFDRLRTSGCDREHLPEQVGGDTAPVVGGRSDVVDRRDLVHQHALSRVDGRALGERGLGTPGADDGGRHAAERDARRAAAGRHAGDDNL